MDKNYRWLTRREANTLIEAGATVEWRYNIDRFAVRPSEDRMTEWASWVEHQYSPLANSVEGYDDQFRIEVE